MLGDDVFVGIAAIITALAGLAGTIFAGFAALRSGQVKKLIDTNGDPRTLGQIASDVAQQVAPAAAEPSEPAPAP